MSVDLDVLTETYLIMKEYVPAKDRQAAADQLIGNLVDMGIADPDFKKFSFSVSVIVALISRLLCDCY